MSAQFTYHYQQPDEYRFSLDSIQFAEFIAKELENHNNLDQLRVLDLCAGCGVIGIQLSWFLRDLSYIDFLEVQDVYTPYFKANIATVNRPELKTQWILENYDTLMLESFENKYDLIVSNPPYFFRDHGMLSPSQFKNRCRFFIDSSYENFIQGIANTLRPKGQAYFLQKAHHHLNLTDIMTQIPNIQFKKIGEIRGVDIIHIQKLNEVNHAII